VTPPTPGGPQPGEAGSGTGSGEAARQRARRAVHGALAATLGLEALTVLFVPRAIAQSGAGLTAVRLAVLLGLAGLLIVGAVLQRHRVGLALGSVLQLGVIATGVFTSAMYVLGGLFALIWIYLLRIRRATLHGVPPVWGR
jgi:hypothetical protein